MKAFNFFSFVIFPMIIISALGIISGSKGVPVPADKCNFCKEDCGKYNGTSDFNLCTTSKKQCNCSSSPERNGRDGFDEFENRHNERVEAQQAKFRENAGTIIGLSLGLFIFIFVILPCVCIGIPLIIFCSIRRKNNRNRRPGAVYNDYAQGFQPQQPGGFQQSNTVIGSNFGGDPSPPYGSNHNMGY